ncbi:anti-sigma F factor antagonist [Peptococcaceae bacterium]|nr:anti-sigma F factor antagonist [Peptococcaceae bacterium]
MQWKFQMIQDTLIARLTGEFDLSVTDEIRSELDDLIDTTKVKHLIFNLSQVNYIDSSGLGIILGRYKRLSKHGGKMALVNPQFQVKKILELSGLMTIMTGYDDEKEAISKIG